MTLELLNLFILETIDGWDQDTCQDNTETMTYTTDIKWC
jgi:hypothetical protein